MFVCEPQSATAGTAPKTVTYTMASLLMLCMGDSRNAAVVARAGAIPALVSVAREATNRPANRELASALLAVMCRSQAAQVDVVASGGIPALTRCVVIWRFMQVLSVQTLILPRRLTSTGSGSCDSSSNSHQRPRRCRPFIACSHPAVCLYPCCPPYSACRTERCCRRCCYVQAACGGHRRCMLLGRRGTHSDCDNQRCPLSPDCARWGAASPHPHAAAQQQPYELVVGS